MKNTSRVLAVLAVFALSANAIAGKGGGGNGFPSGAHYNLNLIGTGNKDADMKGNKGHRIFVPLTGNAKIYLQEGDFRVIDANGTDGDGAKFQLPAADADCNGYSDYSVYVRELGAPGGSAVMTTCLEDEFGEVYCSSESVELVRKKGKSTARNVSKELLTVLIYDEVRDRWIRTPLFGDDSYGYLWDYDNNGLRLAQLRFYDEFTMINIDPNLGDYEYNCN
jgi:hypothetical protein